MVRRRTWHPATLICAHLRTSILQRQTYTLRCIARRSCSRLKGSCECRRTCRCVQVQMSVVPPEMPSAVVTKRFVKDFRQVSCRRVLPRLAEPLVACRTHALFRTGHTVTTPRCARPTDGGSAHETNRWGQSTHERNEQKRKSPIVSIVLL